MDAYIFIRFSTRQQEEARGGSSYERQLQVCREYVQRMGWHEVGLIEDLGRSAWRGDHLRKGNLGKFARRLLAGELPPCVIVVEELDRLSRQKARTTKNWIESVCAAGHSIASANGARVYSEETLDANLLAMMEILVKAEAAHEYSARLSRRAKGSYEKRKREARENGTVITSLGPAWLQAVGKRPNIKWVPVPERTKLIREIFDLAAAGHAPWTIARILNERPDCPSFSGKKWERTSIVKIIRNKAIEGDYEVGEGKTQVPTGEILHGYYGDPIVPLDVVAEARAMLDRRSRKGKGRNSGAVNNLFGQAIRCGKCGGRMMLMGYQSRYLTCYEAGRGNGCDQRKTFKYRPFENAALAAILPIVLDNNFFMQAEKSNRFGLEIAEAQKAARDAQQQAERAYDMWDESGSEIAKRRFHEAEARVRALKAKLSELNDRLAAAQGAATAQAHLARVHNVRDALNNPDDEVRLPARLRVVEAIRSLNTKVQCHASGDARQIVLTTVELDGAVGPAMAFRFDNEGNLLAKLDVMTMIEEYVAQAPAGEVARIVASVGDPAAGVSPPNREAVAAFMRRRAAMLAEPQMDELRCEVASRFA